MKIINVPMYHFLKNMNFMLKLGSFHVLQSRAIFITKWVSFDVLAHKVGKYYHKIDFYYKLGQLLRSRSVQVDYDFNIVALLRYA